MYGFFSTITKQILRNTDCPDDEVDMNLQQDEIAFPGEYTSANYLDDSDPDKPIIADKVSIPHTVTGNIITLPGDALHCEVTGPITDSFEIPAGETELTFTADVPGQYTLTMSGVKYLPTEIDIAI